MDLIINKEKFDSFLEVSKFLNERLKVIPILYGSLGLNRTIGEFSNAKDTDVLIPDIFINERWSEILELMDSIGFELKDLKEHEFIKNGNIVAFAVESDLPKLIGVKVESLDVSELGGAKFKELSAEQYLLFYQTRGDSYRREKKGEADKERISLIQQYLENKK